VCLTHQKPEQNNNSIPLNENQPLLSLIQSPNPQNKSKQRHSSRGKSATASTNSKSKPPEQKQNITMLQEEN
jgi:hypothetical protein